MTERAPTPGAAPERGESAVLPERPERPERPARLVEPARVGLPRPPAPPPARKAARGFTVRRLIAYLSCFAAGALAVTAIDWWRTSLEPPSRAPWGMVLLRPTPAAPERAPATAPQPTWPAPSGTQPLPPAVTPSLPQPMQPLTGAAAGLPVPGGGRRRLGLPIRDLPRTALRDTFTESRGGGQRVHEAIDIMSPRGTPVMAVDEGPVVKLFNSKNGGITLYQYDPTRTYAYYYAHLDRYAEGLHEGAYVRKGDVVGYVGSTGNAAPDAPHLHFQIFRLTPARNWWEGTAINPYPFLAGTGS